MLSCFDLTFNKLASSKINHYTVYTSTFQVAGIKRYIKSPLPRKTYWPMRVGNIIMRDIWRECVVIIGYVYNSLINTSIHPYARLYPSHYPKNTKNNKSFIHCFKHTETKMTFTSWPSCHFQNFSLKDEQRCRIFKATWRAELVLYVGCGPLPSNIIEMKVYRDPLLKM